MSAARRGSKAARPVHGSGPSALAHAAGRHRPPTKAMRRSPSRQARARRPGASAAFGLDGAEAAARDLPGDGLAARRPGIDREYAAGARVLQGRLSRTLDVALGAAFHRIDLVAV